MIVQVQNPSTIAHPGILTNGTWFMDNDASHYLTFGKSHLLTPQAYTGQDQVMLENGHMVPIAHFGNITIQLKDHTLQIIDLLHVPQLTKNLITVKNFA